MNDATANKRKNEKSMPNKIVTYVKNELTVFLIAACAGVSGFILHDWLLERLGGYWITVLHF